MALFEVVSQQEWEAAREQVRAQEAEVARMREAVNAARRRLPAVLVDRQYVLEGPDGKVTLAEIFEGRPQLVVYHFMFHPEWEAGCPFCSHVVDQVGHLSHLNALGTTFAVVSRAPAGKIEGFRRRMGWTWPWYSSADSGFTEDLHVSDDRGGLSVFLRDGDQVYRTYYAFDDEVDLSILEYSYTDLSSLGLPAVTPWPRHHDKYVAG